MRSSDQHLSVLVFNKSADGEQSQTNIQSYGRFNVRPHFG